MTSSLLLRRILVLAAMGPLAGVLAGCGSDSDPGASDAGPGEVDAGDPNALSCESRSGSRVRRVMREHEDGTSEFLRLHDAEIGETCAFGPAGDGSLRCIPAADGAPVAAGTVMYTDPACSARIARLATGLGEAPPTIMQQQIPSDDGCTSWRAHYRLGNQVGVEPGVTTLYTSDGVNCSAVTADGNPYFEITGDMAPSELVGGEESWVGGRLRMRQVDGDDGVRWCDVTGDLRDGDLDDHSCHLGYGEDGAIRCLPRARGVSALFSDEACTAGLSVSITAPTCDSGYQFADESAGSCGERRIRALGAEVAPPVYTMAETCVAQPLTDEQEVYRVGPAVSGTSFASFSRDYRDLGGRLERGDLASGEGVRLFRWQWRDSELDIACAFTPAGDAVPRCLPVSVREQAVATVITRYSDAGCSVPVRVATVNSCDAGTPVHAVEAGGGVSRVFPIAGPAAGPLYEVNGACVEIADLAPYFAVGAEIAASSFVAGEETLE